MTDNKGVEVFQMQYSQNNRRSVRTRSFKTGRIIYDNRIKTLDCIIKNISEDGAKLVLTIPENLPSEFSVRFNDGAEKNCNVRWRVMNEIGVQYL